MNKEKYITPVTNEIEVKSTDIIRTSVFELNSPDELTILDKSYFTEGDGLFNLF